MFLPNMEIIDSVYIYIYVNEILLLDTQMVRRTPW